MKNDNRPIGIFDSGMGGISVLKEMSKLMPNEKFIYYGDSAHAPYGLKSKDEIINRCFDICDTLLSYDVKAIVIACNTATSVASKELRGKYKNIPIIGMEPALKVATKSGDSKTIIVMATPLTLKEEKFNNLLNKCKGNNVVIKMPCPELVNIIESDELENVDLVNTQLNYYLNGIDKNTINSVVLGCTHFIFYKKYLKDILSSNTDIIDGNLGTSNNLIRILKKDCKLADSSNIGDVIFLNSESTEFNGVNISSKLSKLDLSRKLFSI